MLEENGSKILVVLTNHLQSVTPGRLQTYITYKEVHDKLGLELRGRTYGESLKNQGLANLAEWTAENNFPGITGLIIDGQSLQPGEGYYRLFGKDRDDFQWWEEQIRLSKEFDWKPFLPIEFIPESPKAIDIEIPQREQISVLRIIRDTVLARRVKLIYNYECQICSQTIFLQGGKRYAEAHHLKPLGNPHNGPDDLGNIICVCPNHHTELDYGVRKINEGELNVSPNHRLSQIFILYHNTEIYRE